MAKCKLGLKCYTKCKVEGCDGEIRCKRYEEGTYGICIHSEVE